MRGRRIKEAIKDDDEEGDKKTNRVAFCHIYI
jgi:hypothetical protein